MRDEVPTDNLSFEYSPHGYPNANAARKDGFIDHVDAEVDGLLRAAFGDNNTIVQHLEYARKTESPLIQRPETVSQRKTSDPYSRAYAPEIARAFTMHVASKLNTVATSQSLENHGKRLNVSGIGEDVADLPAVAAGERVNVDDYEELCVAWMKRMYGEDSVFVSEALEANEGESGVPPIRSIQWDSGYQRTPIQAPAVVYEFVLCVTDKRFRGRYTEDE